MSLNVQHSYLCKLIWKHPDKHNSILDIIVNDLKIKYALSERNEKQVRKQLTKSFFSQYKQKWQDVSRKKDTFISKHKDFFEKILVIQLVDEEASTSNINTSFINDTSHVFEDTSKIAKVGRPRTSYEKGCSRTKNKRASEIAINHSKEELSLALKLKEQKSSTDSTTETEQNLFSTEYINKVLAMFVDLDLTKRKYEKLRNHTYNIHGNKLYPPYSAIVEAKKACYPEHITFSTNGAKIHLISLLEHTLKRILMTLDKDVLTNATKSLIFVGKWGMDGASGQQTTRQKWNFRDDSIDLSSSDDDSADQTTATDSAVFICNFVPLELRTVDNEILWVNKKPSSVFYCRPINFKFIKESNDVTEKNYEYISALLKKIKNYNFECMEMAFDVAFDIKCTMIDGKTCNVLTRQKASSRCNICGVGPKDINNINYVFHLQGNTEFYKWGFSILHSWIRFMEYVLHISYNLNFKKGSARGSDKDLKKGRKSLIQQSLKNRLSLTVDVVKQGSGTTNTGNVARCFFAKSKAVSQIIGVDEELLTRMHVILQIISCTQEVDLDAFEKYCLATAEKCVELYPWYRMPPSVHKVLIHGCDIMRTFDRPIGFFSEEAQESNNKIFRNIRAGHSRMCERRKTNEDIIHYCLVLSDPVISSLRDVKKKVPKELTSEAKRFLKKS